VNFAKHLNLEGLHAPFSPSKSSWLRYSDDRLIEVYLNKKAAEMGTRLHQWAKETIDLGLKQPRSSKTIYAYVNDAIGFRMSTEVVLYYSNFFFGTADTISFRKNFLRIHDLKTGKNPASMEQLMIYAALFCLEYKIKPGTIDIELRLYQNDDVERLNSIDDPSLIDDIAHIMDRIIHLNKTLEKLESEEV
jgi:hypothetical protein